MSSKRDSVFTASLRDTTALLSRMMDLDSHRRETLEVDAEIAAAWLTTYEEIVQFLTSFNELVETFMEDV